MLLELPIKHALNVLLIEVAVKAKKIIVKSIKLVSLYFFFCVFFDIMNMIMYSR